MKRGYGVRRAGLLIYSSVCMAIAINATTQMYVSFAPGILVREADPKIRDALQRTESDGIERVREFWMGSVFPASCLLAINSVMLAVAAWR